MEEEAATAFEAAMAHHSAAGIRPHLTYEIHQGVSLANLPTEVTFDAVVSPANSYAILDGGFDDALSRAFGPRGDYAAVTAAAQRTLRARHRRGYLPPGSCEMVDLPPIRRGEDQYGVGQRIPEDETEGWETVDAEKEGGAAKGAGEEDEDKDADDADWVRPWGCRYMALCPTMRVPSNCSWDREVVYECIWSLMGQIERHNGEGNGPLIRSVLMTPLGTGVGRVSYTRWARQTVLALKHWVEATPDPDAPLEIRKWSNLSRIEAEILPTQGL
jgi:O-acetyl-ADP-ribose deacetylase (regulator of RNase III)